MVSELALIALAVCNVALISILWRAHRSHVQVRTTHRWLVPMLVGITLIDVIASSMHAGWSVTAPLIAADIAIIVVLYRLIIESHRLRVEAERAQSDIAWRREEQQRALIDRCANLY